jgi:hypothetical protein
MKFNRLILVIGFVFVLSGYKADAQTKVNVNNCFWITHKIVDGPDGLAVNDYELGNGPDDYYMFYSDSSKTILIMEGELSAGFKQGEWKYYNPDGTLYNKCNYFNGLMNGLCEFFNPDGTVSLSVMMIDDKPIENHK